MNDLALAVPHGQRKALYDNIFRGLAQEHGFRPLRVEGKLPPTLRGTLYRNGPAVFDAGTDPHWFDGNGAITAVRLDGKSVEGTVRLLHSPTADHDAGRRNNRYGAFRQAASRMQRLRALFGQRALRNPANINVLQWRERLFALYETVLPLEFDPETLATIGETNLDGLIPGAWNAHPHYVPARRTTYHIGLRTGPKVFLDIFALPDRGPGTVLTSLQLPGLTEAHDFFATENYLVLVLPPLWGAPLRFVQTGSFLGSLEWRPEGGTDVIVVPLDDPKNVMRMQTEPFFYWHAANGYETDGGQRIVLDCVRYPDFPRMLDWLEKTTHGRSGEGTSGSALWRGEIDLRRRRVRWEERWARSCEFPMVQPAERARAHRYVWLAAHSAGAEDGWLDRLARVDVERDEAVMLDPGPKRAVGEPILVAKPDAPHEAWVLALVRDLGVGATHLAVWDGARPEDDAVARVWFDQQLPPSLHGMWVPEH